MLLHFFRRRLPLFAVVAAAFLAVLPGFAERQRGVAARRSPAPALRSPWDARPVAVTTVGYSCPGIDPLPHDIVAASFYSDPKHSIIDERKYAAYRAAADHFNEVSVQAAKAADAFRATGSAQAAACVLRILDAQAAVDSMTGAMSTNQAFYVQNWTLGALAVTWLKVRSANPGTPSERQSAMQWMGVVAGQVRTYFAGRNARGTNDGTNNHLYWAGFAVMASGIATNNRPLYDWGAFTLEEAMSRVTPEGTLPLEMDRGQRALHYHLFALAPIVEMAEFEEANGQHPYNEHNMAIGRLAKRALMGLMDNSYFSQAAHAQQDTPATPGEVKSDDVIWLLPFLQRFPDENFSKLLHAAHPHPNNYLGGWPPGWPIR